ncbi:MAG: SIR2 family protein [Ignavibacteriales bacterium]|nr:SIR2 family protein [Ignavibacteriales bacterium]
MSKDNHIVLIADFKPDNSFFDDLREGHFCLVLGAGFSFGVKNKNKEFSTIPTAEQFIKFTNEKFTKSVTEYKAAASVWENKIANNPNLLNELRNLFLVDETAFNFELFDSVFLPNWYSIFTFNFDNVLTTIQSKHKGKKYPVFNYPAYTMDSNDNCILHLHGLMNEETTLDNIVFTSASYTKLGAEQNSLYNVIYGDIDSNKKN